MKYFFFLLLIACCTVSCGPDFIFDEDFQLDAAGWTYENDVRFEFNAPDTTDLFTLWLTIDHSTEYAYENVYVKIKTVFPDQPATEQILSLEIADKFGNFQGQCTRDHCLSLIPLQTNLRFKAPGEHAIIIQQNSRVNPLVGINALSVAVERLPSK